MKNLYLKSAFIYFIILAVLGTLLRLTTTYPIALNYKFLLHTHSHIAFLGWVYSAFFALYIDFFSSKKTHQLKAYKTQFFLTQLANIGMLIAFPIQGYGVFSILFSTMHIFISYWFAYTVYSDIKENILISPIIKKIANAALLFLILSSGGPFMLPIVMKLFGSGSNPYYNAIYYYLHFQYNGWFTFSLLAIALSLLEKKGVIFEFILLKKLFYSFFYSTFITLFISFLWTKPPIFINYISGIGALLQLYGLYLLYKIFNLLKRQNNYKVDAFSKNIARFIFFCLIIKIIFQCFGSFPYFAILSYEIRNFIIGYLHLFLIGVVSLSIIFICIENEYFKNTKQFRMAVNLFISGFILSEIWIFTQGLAGWIGYSGIPFYNQSLLAFSTILLIATGIFSFKLK